MANIYGLHEVKLKPGVTGEELERFFREEVSLARPLEGWDVHLLKQCRGPERNEYLVAWVIEEQRHKMYCPEISEELEQWQQDNAELWAKWRGSVDVERWADYQVIV